MTGSERLGVGRKNWWEVGLKISDIGWRWALNIVGSGMLATGGRWEVGLQKQTEDGRSRVLPPHPLKKIYNSIPW